MQYIYKPKAHKAYKQQQCQKFEDWLKFRDDQALVQS